MWNVVTSCVGIGLMCPPSNRDLGESRVSYRSRCQAPPGTGPWHLFVCGRSVDEGYPARKAPLIADRHVEQPGEVTVHLIQTDEVLNFGGKRQL
jgi:hypothetical protein